MQRAVSQARLEKRQMASYRCLARSQPHAVHHAFVGTRQWLLVCSFIVARPCDKAGAHMQARHGPAAGAAAGSAKAPRGCWQATLQQLQGRWGDLREGMAYISAPENRRARSGMRVLREQPTKCAG